METKQRVATMEVVVDRKKCINSGMCTTIAPTVFALGDDGVLVLIKKQIGNQEVSAVRDAIACCPVEAIDLTK